MRLIGCKVSESYTTIQLFGQKNAGKTIFFPAIFFNSYDKMRFSLPF